MEKNRGGEGWKGGEELESVSQARKRKLRLTAYAIRVASMEEDFNSLNFFIVEQQKKRTFSLKRDRLGACCLTILICLRVLNVLRVRCDHATPTFSDLKVSIYIAKGEYLYR